jgi:hypothetical protein
MPIDGREGVFVEQGLLYPHRIGCGVDRGGRLVSVFALSSCDNNFKTKRFLTSKLAWVIYIVHTMGAWGYLLGWECSIPNELAVA